MEVSGVWCRLLRGLVITGRRDSNHRFDWCHGVVFGNTVFWLLRKRPANIVIVR